MIFYIFMNIATEFRGISSLISVAARDYLDNRGAEPEPELEPEPEQEPSKNGAAPAPFLKRKMY